MEVYLETPRLVLREFLPTDLDHLLELDADPLVMRWARPGQGPPDRETYARELLPRFMEYPRINRHFGYWAAVETEGNRFVGWFHFRPSKDEPTEIELGYRLLERGRHKGYATEGARGLLRKGFLDLRLSYAMATTLAGNSASIHVLEKCGMKLEKEFVYPGLDLPGLKYSMTRNDYLARSAGRG